MYHKVTSERFNKVQSVYTNNLSGYLAFILSLNAKVISIELCTQTEYNFYHK